MSRAHLFGRWGVILAPHLCAGHFVPARTLALMAYGPIKARKNGMYQAKARRAAVATNKAARYASSHAYRTGFRTVARTRGWAAARGETKYFESFRAAIALPASVDWTGTEFDPASTAGQLGLASPPQGTGIGERVGRKICVKKIRIRGQVKLTADTALSDGPFLVRILLVQDKQTNAVQAQGEQVLAYGGVGGPLATGNGINAMQSTATFGRFRILKDILLKSGDYNYNAIGGGQQVWMPFKISVKLNQIVNFNTTTTGTITDVVDNSFHIMANCTNINAAPTIQYVARVVYTDY